ncbi:glycosyltransferase involved in cell wall biosynthesis [Rhodobium orientis]|nr:glycosyltransferase involved in cell wall biosynthesis [Rhodobium orientis]
MANNSRISETAAEAATEFAKVIKVEENLGYSGAVNLGAEKASGKILIFCDDDVIVTPGWFENMLEFHLSSSRIGATAVKLISPSTGRVVDFGIAFTEYNAPHLFQDVLPSHPLTLIRRRVQAACSALMMIDKELFAEVGGFSVPNQSHYSDLELCLKIKQKQKQIWVLGDVTCYHKSSYVTDERAAYKSGEIKCDAKAGFFKEFGHLIETDLDNYYKLFIKAEGLQDLMRNTEFSLVSLANVMNPKWYHNIISKYFSINSIYDLPTYQRDNASLSLMKFLGSNFVHKNSPLIYFVDRYKSLKENAYWFGNRVSNSDVIFDRNGNVFPVEILLKEQEWSTDELCRTSAKSNDEVAVKPTLQKSLDEAKSVLKEYSNTSAGNDKTFRAFTHLVNSIPALRAHRDYVEANEWGFGDRAFHMMWLNIINELSMSEKPITALEIGVFRGQIISLWHLIADLLGIQLHSIGITPLAGTNEEKGTNSTAGSLKKAKSFYPDSDYIDDIRRIFSDFRLDIDRNELIRGYSQDPTVKSKILGKKFDIIYIDGDHRYKCVKSDIEYYQNLVNDNGYLIIDDAGCDMQGNAFWKGIPSVTKALKAIDSQQFENLFNVGHNRVFLKRQF